MKRRSFVIVLILNVAFASLTVAQEKSVRPGINDAFKSPDVEEWVKRFEGESREVYNHRQAVVDALGLEPGMVVADVGAGTGLYTRLFSHEVGDKGLVYAVDIAPKFLAHIEKSAKEFQLTNIKTVLGTDASAQLPDDSVDVVFICDTYHHFEYPQRMMASLYKALKPNGRIILIDFIREEGKSREWTLSHVRAGQDVFESEIESEGFHKTGEVKDMLEENYFVIFEKAKPKSTD